MNSHGKVASKGKMPLIAKYSLLKILCHQNDPSRLPVILSHGNFVTAISSHSNCNSNFNPNLNSKPGLASELISDFLKILHASCSSCPGLINLNSSD